MKNFLLCLFVCLFAFAKSFADPSNFPRPYYVGELGAQWDFPSDHLPVGGTIGKINFCFWNILNKGALYHLENNQQGLANSSLISNNVALCEEESITIREILIVEMILKMIHNHTHPRSLIGLCEVHKDVTEYLDEVIPNSWKIVSSGNNSKSQNLLLYDSDVFEFYDIETKNYALKPSSSIIVLTLKEKATGQFFKFIHSHIPGGPLTLCYSIKEFVYEVFQQYDPKMAIILMGDMNVAPSTITSALKEEFSKNSMPKIPFHYFPSAYPTHIDLRRWASWIDNLFIYHPHLQHEIKVSEDSLELFDELKPIVELLNEMKVQKEQEIL